MHGAIPPLLTEDYNCYQLCIVSNILASKLTPYVDEIIRDDECGF
jgi:hypothetical protein